MATASCWAFFIRTTFLLNFRAQEVDKGVAYQSNGVSVILSDVPTTIRLFGHKFSNHTIVRFVAEAQRRLDDCDDTPSTRTFLVS